jgi:hypothetical protein
MTSRMSTWIMILILVACLGIWAGCTRESSITVSQPNGQSQGTSNSYFPVAEGKMSTYAISSPGGASSTLTIRLGSKIPFGADSAWQWFAIRPDYSIDTDYVVVTATTVVSYENANSEPETILRAPLLPGQNWSRFPATTQVDVVLPDTTTLATDYTGGIVTKGNGHDDPGGDNGNGSGKVVPIAGGAQATVDGIEEVVLSNGSHYSGALRIETANTSGTANYYWFAPAYGLVKYVLGATPTRPDGSQMGELLN